MPYGGSGPAPRYISVQPSKRQRGFVVDGGQDSDAADFVSGASFWATMVRQSSTMLGFAELAVVVPDSGGFFLSRPVWVFLVRFDFCVVEADGGLVVAVDEFVWVSFRFCGSFSR